MTHLNVIVFFYFYLPSSLLVKELEPKKCRFGTIYVKDNYFLIYSYIAPGNFSLRAKKSCRKRNPLGSYTAKRFLL